MADADGLPYRPCVGIVLTDGRGRVWSGQRADSAEPAWQFPQGGIDAGEDPRQAALRELVEETGIPPQRVAVTGETAGWYRYDLPSDLVGKALGGRFRGQTQKWVLLTYLGRDAEIRIDTDHPEFSAWAWITPQEALRRIVPFKRDIYAGVLGEFGLLAGTGH